MKTFFQFVEAKLFNQYTQDHEVSRSGIEEVVSQLSHEQRVEFSLYCAKDCFHLNDEHTREQAERCIRLVEDWLYSENKPSRNQLTSTANEANSVTSYDNGSSAAIYATLSARSAVYSIVYANSNYFKFYAFNYAANAANAANNDVYGGDTYKKKMQQYLNVAKSYLISSDFKPDVPFFNKKEVDKLDLHGFLDYIEDNQMEIFDKDNEGNVVLDLAGYKLVAKDIHEMIDKISKDVNVINQLRRMFKI